MTVGAVRNPPLLSVTPIFTLSQNFSKASVFWHGWSGLSRAFGDLRRWPARSVFSPLLCVGVYRMSATVLTALFSAVSSNSPLEKVQCCWLRPEGSWEGLCARMVWVSAELHCLGFMLPRGQLAFQAADLRASTKTSDMCLCCCEDFLSRC